MSATYNFGSGPSQLPGAVLERFSTSFLNWKNSGMSVGELPHRGIFFQDILEETKSLVRELLGLNDEQEVLFMQGGARGQNAIVPLNLLKKSKKCDFVITGLWSKFSAKEAEKYGDVSIVNKLTTESYERIPEIDSWVIRNDTSYLHLCTNETVHGVEFQRVPDLREVNRGHVPLVLDCSSNLFSRALDLSNVALAYASTQKNLGVAGVTLVIINKKLVESCIVDPPEICPSVFSYKNVLSENSCQNTPPTIPIFVTKLVLEWIKESGGVDRLAEINAKKSKALYDYIDKSNFYYSNVDISCRSRVNIPFFLKDSSLNDNFVEGAMKRGLLNLKGHPVLGGIRASVYNGMPMKGVLNLLDWMSTFEKEYCYEAQ